MRVMLDTNVIISFILFNNERMNLFFNYLLKNDTWVISNIIIDELKEVFNKKFPNKIDVLNTFLKDIEAEEIIVKNVENKKLFRIRDEKDYDVLYAAIVSKVDLFITGDEDFKEVDIETPKIMTIKDYILTYIIK
ncbi:MAG: putative toxin-antitoxin system toxin component, PIN family [Lachnospiraceae bacterium]|nr:putative toxin-antitoxin system toxin component, PIN family [Lachnospiraceae bacterium]